MAKKKSETAPETAPETTASVPEVDERERVAAEIKAQMAALAERYDFDVASKTKEEYGEVPIEELHNIEGLDSRAGMTPLDKAFVQSLKKDDGSPHKAKISSTSSFENWTVNLRVRPVSASEKRPRTWLGRR
jgi:hypothetical protein